MSDRFFIVAVPDEVGHQTTLEGIPVHFCGVGKVNAALGAFELISRGARHIINIGSCGSRKHGMGELLKIGRVYQDIDARPISDYGITPFEDEAPHIELDPLAAASCFTTDYFFDETQSSKYSPAYLHRLEACSVIDMELYAIAKICQRFGVTCSAYKWVSDNGSFEHWKENCKLSLDKLMQHPIF